MAKQAAQGDQVGEEAADEAWAGCFRIAHDDLLLLRLVSD